MNHNCKYKLHPVNTTEKILIQTSQTVNRVHHLFKEWCCKSLKIITLKMVHVILKKFEGLPQDSTSFKLVYIAVWLASSNKLNGNCPWIGLTPMAQIQCSTNQAIKPTFFPSSSSFSFSFALFFSLNPSTGKLIGTKHSREQAYLESHALNLLVHWWQAIQEARRWLLHCTIPSQERSSSVTMAWQEGGMGMNHVRKPGTRPGQSQSG